MKLDDLEGHVADQHTIRHARSKKRRRNRKRKGKKFDHKDILQIDPAFATIMKMKKREIRRARFKVKYFLAVEK